MKYINLIKILIFIKEIILLLNNNIMNKNYIKFLNKLMIKIFKKIKLLII